MSLEFLLKDNSQEAIEELHNKTAAILEAIGAQAEGYAKMACPVDTGRLRNSISHAPIDDDTEAIGTNVEYAAYVEMGTQRTKAHPYLKPAVNNHKDEYINLAKSILKN